MKTPRDRDSEKKQLSDYRRHSISASIYDPLSLRDVIKRSSDNLVILGKFSLEINSCISL